MILVELLFCESFCSIEMSINLDKLSEGVEYNILLIGLSSKGKSTFINAFVNYLKYNSLDEAMAGGCVEVIATRFRLKDEQTGKMLEIESGNDENEVNSEDKYNGIYTNTRNIRVYSIHHNNRLIRFIDTPGVGTNDLETSSDNYFYAPANNYLHDISQCLGNFVKLHAIVLVSSRPLSLLQTISKSASTNIVYCYVDKFTDKPTKDKIFETLIPFFESTTITPHPGENLLALDNRAYQCLIAHRQGHSFSDERIDKYRTCWNEASEQIQNMIDYVASVEACDCTNVLELMQSFQIWNLGFDLISHYLSKTSDLTEISETLNLLEQNPSEYSKIELICAKLWSMVIYSSVVSWGGFKDLMEIYRVHPNKSMQNFIHEVSSLYPNSESFEAKLIDHSSRKHFHELFTELKNLQHSGKYFTEKINRITQNEANKNEIQEITITVKPDNSFEIKKNFYRNPQIENNLNSTTSSLSSYHLDDYLFSPLEFHDNHDNLSISDTSEHSTDNTTSEEQFTKYQNDVKHLVELQQIIFLLIQNNKLLIEIKGLLTDYKRTALSNATLENVVFACDNSKIEIGDLVMKSTHLNMKEENIQFILENIDRLIKSNFINLIPVLQNYQPAKQVIENEIAKQQQEQQDQSLTDFNLSNISETTDKWTLNKNSIEYKTSKPSSSSTSTHLIMQQVIDDKLSDTSVQDDEMHSKLDAILKFLAIIEFRLFNVECSQLNTEKRLSSVENSQMNVEKRLSSVESSQEIIEKRLSSIEEKFRKK